MQSNPRTGFRRPPNDRDDVLIAAGRADPTQSLARVLLTSDPGDESHCGRKRFQDIASRLFLHRAHTHQLITRSERAAALGIGAGTRVTFRYRGKLLQGRVNRITKRATVLVEDPEGTRWSDGRPIPSSPGPIRAPESGEV